MTSYSTLISGDKYFPYHEHLNAVHPDHVDAQFFIPKHNSHTFMGKSWNRNFWKNDNFEDNFPYTLGEDSLRLYQLSVINNLSDDLQFEALIFNFHKVYPPGDKSSPELSEKGLSEFDEKFVQKLRRLIKYNSMVVREAFGIPVKISPKLLEMHRQLQANVLFFLQHKTDKELELMNLPIHTEMLELYEDSTPDGDQENNVIVLDGIKMKDFCPSDENSVRRLWWREFRRLGGEQRYERYGLAKYNEVHNKHRQCCEE